MTIALTVVRVLLGLVFVAAGLPKLLSPDMVIQNFERWGLPVAEAFAPAVGVLEVVAGAMLVLGVFTRYAAVLLAANMVGAVLTAGLVEGGVTHLVVAPILGALSVLIAVLGGGRLQLRPGPGLPGVASGGSRAAAN